MSSAGDDSLTNKNHPTKLLLERIFSADVLFVRFCRRRNDDLWFTAADPEGLLVSDLQTSQLRDPDSLFLCWTADYCFHPPERTGWPLRVAAVVYWQEGRYSPCDLRSFNDAHQMEKHESRSGGTDDRWWTGGRRAMKNRLPPRSESACLLKMTLFSRIWPETRGDPKRSISGRRQNRKQIWHVVLKESDALKNIPDSY